MTKTFSLACIGATALWIGCSAGVKATNPTGTAGTSGGGTSGGGTTGNGGSSSTGTGGTLPGFDASIDLGGGDARTDGVCSATMTPAEPVPLDLYVLMDSSLSMNETTST